MKAAAASASKSPHTFCSLSGLVSKLTKSVTPCKRVVIYANTYIELCTLEHPQPKKM